MKPQRLILGWALAALVGFCLGVGFASRTRPASSPSSPVMKAVNQAAQQPAPVASAPTEPANPPKQKSTGTMPDDLRDALRNRAAGEYVRDSNVPSLRAQRFDYARRAADATMARRDAEYADLFAALGLDATTNSQLRKHLREILEAKADAGHTMGEVLQAETDYDERVKQLLGDKYEVYRAEEAAYSSRREFEKIAGFAAAQQMSALPADRAAVEKLIQNFQAYSLETEGEWGGPYQGVPPSVGGENLAPFLSAKLATLKTQSALLLGEARTAGLSEPTVAVLEKYYRDNVAKLQTQLARVEDPDLNRRIMITQQLDRAKASSDPNPRLIQRLEAQLNALSK